MARRESARSVRQGWRPLRPARLEMRREEHRLELSLRARLQLKAAGWRPPLLVALASSRVKTADPPSPGLRRAGWRPQLLGPQD